MKKYKYWVVPLLIVLVIVLWYFSGVSRYFTFEFLKTHREDLSLFVAKHWILAPLLFTVLFTLAVATLLPVGIFMTLVGGFLFSTTAATIYCMVASTVGSILIFYALKGSMKTLHRHQSNLWLKKVEEEFLKSQINYLLFLRLFPFSPLWLVNLACAFFGVRPWTFIWTTLVGNLPSTFALIEVAEQMKTLFRFSQPLTFGNIFHWKMILAMIALAFLSIIPVLYSKFRKKSQF